MLRSTRREDWWTRAVPLGFFLVQQARNAVHTFLVVIYHEKHNKKWNRNRREKRLSLFLSTHSLSHVLFFSGGVGSIFLSAGA